MKSALSLVLLLLLTGSVTARGPGLSDALHEDDHGTAVHRHKRWSGLGLFDALRGKGAKATRPPTGDPKPSEPPGGNGFGFNLEDALRPAVKPTDKPSGGGCQGDVVRMLRTVSENQKQQLRLLLQLAAQSPSARLRR